MPPKLVYEDDAARLLARRVDRAISALTDTLNNFKPRDRHHRIEKPRAVAPRSNKQAVLLALLDALERDAQPDGLGALTWYELRAASKLTDDALGLALTSLIPAFVCTRDDGDARRIYFLPRAERRRARARMSSARLERVA